MAYTPFKMRGSPFKRNFGVGDSEAPDKTSPLNDIPREEITYYHDHPEGGEETPVKSKFGEALSAGMATLPGGYDAHKQREEAKLANVEYEKDEDGKLILGEDGKPIPIEDKTEEKTKGASIVENLVKGLFFKDKKEEKTEE